MSRLRVNIVALYVAFMCLMGFFTQQTAAESLETLSDIELEEMLEATDKPFILVYWASWCVPCRHFREKLEQIRKDYTEESLCMLAVSLDREPQRVAAYLAETPLPYPARIGDAALQKARAGMPVPTTVLYRRDGTVDHTLVGDVSEKRLRHYVERIVEQKKK